MQAMNLSFWELRSWLTDIDFCIVGSGITGITCALGIKEKNPNARILILEKGVFPQGASTKNAGFACFGSITEILDDLLYHTPEEVQNLVSQRFSGIELLRKRLGDKALDFQQLGGYEIFREQEHKIFNEALDKLDLVNELLQPVFRHLPFELRKNTFGLSGVLPELICNPLEGQIDTGKAMDALLEIARQKSIQILNGIRFSGFEDLGNAVQVKTEYFEFMARKLILATNGFAGSQTGLDVLPARAQVLITTPILNLKVKGSFHLDSGYYYFRNIGNRLLFGGGRNLDKAGETTEEFGETALIQEELERLLKVVILPDVDFRIEHRWSGIMGVGPQKKPIIQAISPNVVCGVRLGGMGVALGSHVGAQLAEMAS